MMTKADVQRIADAVLAKMGGMAVAQAPLPTRAEAKAQAAKVAERASFKAFLVERAKRSEARKALAAKMRARGLDVSNPLVWKTAKKAAGIA